MIPNTFQDISLKEKCIIVDEEDNVLGSASKLDCHKIQSDGSLILHRAFSLFIFNSKGEILLQQRSPNKITFPHNIANACCSHPLYEIEHERNEKNAVGVKLAAQRRMNIELGVTQDQTSLDDFHYITRILYKSKDNIEWGEHELDYILFLKKDLDIVPNPEEISNVKYVAQKDFDDYISNLKHPISPWFKLCTKYFLHHWWKNLHNLDVIKDHSTIHRLY
ncbi:isopentenyl-diphosphate delta-isomerase, putative [Pediculus humanus corporis]|uniref:isopentenyl-diphosphate Delta-isomerase n=1 Tax=Pediculus humanus subsp. corporis TaxID=121224 RepID=E0VV85_PEDHC|nr:isopentenyl-diphosphate delta-isomerase, putative [Pediculus humanus corporis]EEB17291.1 isopentenyl-diphosphate delta-isomerase, putative [Pediculus humanus corporis]